MVSSLDSPRKRCHQLDYCLHFARAVGVLLLVKHLNTVNIALEESYLTALVNWMTLMVMRNALSFVMLPQPLDYVADSLALDTFDDVVNCKQERKKKNEKKIILNTPRSKWILIDFNNIQILTMI